MIIKPGKVKVVSVQFYLYMYSSANSFCQLNFTMDERGTSSDNKSLQIGKAELI